MAKKKRKSSSKRKSKARKAYGKARRAVRSNPKTSSLLAGVAVGLAAGYLLSGSSKTTA